LDKTYYSAQGVKAKCNLDNVSPLEEVGSLENLFVWNAIFADALLESAIERKLSN
jgi:hypothetical protein